MKFLIKAIRKMRLDREEGSFTLEASMVLPAVFASLLAMILFSLYVYQQVVVYSVASLASERAAFRWDNSKRDPVSGMGVTGQYDGLYWRMSGNGALESLFGLAGSASGANAETVVNFGGNGNGVNGGEGGVSSLPVAKMSKIAGRVPDAFEGRMIYSYGLIEKRIETAVREPMAIQALQSLNGLRDPSAASGADIVDPVEFIRNVDLVRYYTTKFNQMPNAAAQRGQAAAVLAERGTLQNQAGP